MDILAGFIGCWVAFLINLVSVVFYLDGTEDVKCRMAVHYSLGNLKISILLLIESQPYWPNLFYIA